MRPDIKDIEQRVLTKLAAPTGLEKYSAEVYLTH